MKRHGKDVKCIISIDNSKYNFTIKAAGFKEQWESPDKKAEYEEMVKAVEDNTHYPNSEFLRATYVCDYPNLFQNILRETEWAEVRNGSVDWIMEYVVPNSEDYSHQIDDEYNKYLKENFGDPVVDYDVGTYFYSDSKGNQIGTNVGAGHNKGSFMSVKFKKAK